MGSHPPLPCPPPWAALTSSESHLGEKLHFVVEVFKCKEPRKMQPCPLSGTNKKETAEVENSEWDIEGGH